MIADEPPMSWMAASDGEAGGAGGAGRAGGDGGHHGHDMGAAKPGALMTGMATKEELAALGAAHGRDAEVLYLQLMTDHHKGGVAMARGCARQCATPAERALAQGDGGGAAVGAHPDGGHAEAARSRAARVTGHARTVGRGALSPVRACAPPCGNRRTGRARARW
ncbi:hypothetical protein GCM10020254_58660 [Streptomyces goshikiensis]